MNTPATIRTVMFSIYCDKSIKRLVVVNTSISWIQNFLVMLVSQLLANVAS